MGGQYLVNSGSILGQFWDILGKPHGNLMETSWKPHVLPVFTRIYPYLTVIYPYLPVFTVFTRYTVCSHTPRFSYGLLKRAVLSVAWPGSGVRVGGYRVGYGTGWVPGGGYYTGYYPAAKDVHL